MAAATRRILRWFSLGRGGWNRGFGALAEGKNVSSSSQNPHRFRVSIQSSQVKFGSFAHLPFLVVYYSFGPKWELSLGFTGGAYHPLPKDQLYETQRATTHIWIFFLLFCGRSGSNWEFFSSMGLRSVIQTSGLATSEKLLACDWLDVRPGPDVVILGKVLGGEVIPVCAVLADKDVMLCIRPGGHGSESPLTFGGNPLAGAVAVAALDMILDEKLAERYRTYWNSSPKRSNSILSITVEHH